MDRKPACFIQRLWIVLVLFGLLFAPVWSGNVRADTPVAAGGYTITDVALLEIPVPDELSAQVGCKNFAVGGVSAINDDGSVVGYLPKSIESRTPFVLTDGKLTKLKSAHGGGALPETSMQAARSSD